MALAAARKTAGGIVSGAGILLITSRTARNMKIDDDPTKANRATLIPLYLSQMPDSSGNR